MHVASRYFTQYPSAGSIGTDAFTQNWQVPHSVSARPSECLHICCSPCLEAALQSFCNDYVKERVQSHVASPAAGEGKPAQQAQTTEDALVVLLPFHRVAGILEHNILPVYIICVQT